MTAPEMSVVEAQLAIPPSRRIITAAPALR
jgi:hypothetical protein